MKRLYFREFLLFALIACININASAQTHKGVWSTSILNKEVHHQGINHLDIIISYTLKPQETKILTDWDINRNIDSLLVLYPNTTDWWEIVNKNVTAFFMENYKGIDSFSSNILVHWTSGAGVDYGHRYPTRCITSRTSSGKLYEYFGFITPIDSMFKCIQSGAKNGKVLKLYIDLRYQYIQQIDNKDYPDGLATENDYKKLLDSIAQKVLDWDEIIEKTQWEMLRKYPKILGLTSEIIVYNAGGEIFEAKKTTKR